MTAPRKRFEFTPLTMTWAEVAEYVFRRNESWLRDFIVKTPDFPRPDPVTKLFSRKQVERWVDYRYGEIGPTSSDHDEAALIERARAMGHGKR